MSSSSLGVHLQSCLIDGTSRTEQPALSHTQGKKPRCNMQLEGWVGRWGDRMTPGGCWEAFRCAGLTMRAITS